MTKALRVILVVSIILNIAFIALFLYHGSLPPWPSPNQVSPSASAYQWQPFPYYVARISIFDQIPLSSDDIVFVGDSITDQGEWEQLFHSLNVKNRGIGADTTQGVLHRLQEITNAKPKKIFLMIGINDLMQRGVASLPAILND